MENTSTVYGVCKTAIEGSWFVVGGFWGKGAV